MQSKQHWEQVYSTKAVDEVSWFQDHAALSIKIISNNHVQKTAQIIDVGGGASPLVDDLLEAGYRNLSVLDLSATALSKARARLGSKADAVQWLEGSILDLELAANHFDVWHDRAVFHFLSSEAERRQYVNQVLRAVKPGGLVIVATFAEDGPEKCSGLPVMRYSKDALHAEFGQRFALLGSELEMHITPAGKQQKFMYCFCRRLP